MEVLVNCDGVRVRYTSRFASASSVGPFSFSLGSSAIHAFEGPNGCGKSTVLRSIAGLQPHEGTIDIRIPRSQIVYIPQRPSQVLVPWLTLDDHIRAFGARGDSSHLEGLREVLDQLQWPAEKRLDATTPAMLSVGLRQVFSIAAGLSRPEARLFLLDEPFSALDAARRERVSRRVIEMCEGQGSTFLIATHLPLDHPRVARLDLFRDLGSMAA